MWLNRLSNSMLTLILANLASSYAAGEPIQVQSAPARQLSSKSTGGGKNVAQIVFSPQITSVTTATINPDGSVQLSCKTQPSESQEMERNEQPKWSASILLYLHCSTWAKLLRKPSLSLCRWVTNSQKHSRFQRAALLRHFISMCPQAPRVSKLN